MKKRYTKFFEAEKPFKFIIKTENISDFSEAPFFAQIFQEAQADSKEVKSYLELIAENKKVLVITGYLGGKISNQEKEMYETKEIFKPTKAMPAGIVTLGILKANGLKIPAIEVSDLSTSGILINTKYFNQLKPYILKEGDKEKIEQEARQKEREKQKQEYQKEREKIDPELLQKALEMLKTTSWAFVKEHLNLSKSEADKIYKYLISPEAK